MKKSMTAVLAAGLLAAGLAAVPAAAAPAAKAPELKWGKCASERLQQAGAECARLTVPMDKAHPKDGTVTLAVSRVKHTVPDSQYEGVMLTNPGGPGGSGLELSTLGSEIPNGVGKQYDWIGFDPRGVGASSPSVNCKQGYFGYNRPDYRPRGTTNVWLQRTDSYDDACQPYRNLLKHMKTTDNVADMESIRTALGADEINYYGFSYGTYLGQVYSTLHPDRMRRMVLDSNVDPRNVWYKANLNQNVAFDRNVNIWFGWLAKHDDAYHLGDTQKKVHDLWYGELVKAAKSPFGGKIGPDEWTDAFLNAGYYQATWTELAEAFAAWVNDGNLQPVLDEYAPNMTKSNENGFAVYNATQCTDTRWPQDWSTWRQDAERVNAEAPFETWANTWFNSPCLDWPAQWGTPVDVDGSKVSGGLLVGETLDAATPYEGNLEVRSRFPNTSLIGEPGGTTHAGTLYGNACVDDTIAEYLDTGTQPARKEGRRADKICDPLPQPTPDKAKSAAPEALAAAGTAETPGRMPLAQVAAFPKR